MNLNIYIKKNTICILRVNWQAKASIVCKLISSLLLSFIFIVSCLLKFSQNKSKLTFQMSILMVRFGCMKIIQNSKSIIKLRKWKNLPSLNNFTGVLLNLSFIPWSSQLPFPFYFYFHVSQPFWSCLFIKFLILKKKKIIIIIWGLSWSACREVHVKVKPKRPKVLTV